MGLIRDSSWNRTKVGPYSFRASKLGMCKCNYDCYHKKQRDKAKSLQRIYAKYINTANFHVEKISRIKQLRLINSKHDAIEVELILDWLRDNGLPSDRNSRCVSPLQWAVANDCRPVLAKAKELASKILSHSKRETKTVEYTAEAEAALSVEARQLSIFHREYASTLERRTKIAAEVDLIRAELNKPDLEETTEIVTYAIARICQRIELGLPMLENRLVG